MGSPVISIIIPVYNAELYIEQCLNSLLSQTFTEYEIICVDDGSKDCSYNILKKYEKSDNRIKVYSQKNSFAGVARNTGMERATGKYLLFLDADDFFEINMLEEIVHKAEEDNTEILIFDACRFNDLSKKIIKESWNTLSVSLFGDGIKSAVELSDNIFQITTPSPWNKLFLKEYVEKKGIKYQPIQRTNDLFFVFAALSQAKRIGILNKKLVYYRINNQSSLQGSIEKDPFSFGDALVALKAYLDEKKNWEKFKKSFYTMTSEVCMNNLVNMQSEKMYNLLCKKIKYDIISQLGMEITKKDEKLSKVFDTKMNIIIYGAGAVSKALIQYLFLRYKYNPSKIKIVVSNASDNRKELYGIRVNSIHDLYLNRHKDFIVIAVADKKLQNEIEKYVRMIGYIRVTKIDFSGILALILDDSISAE